MTTATATETEMPTLEEEWAVLDLPSFARRLFQADIAGHLSRLAMIRSLQVANDADTSKEIDTEARSLLVTLLGDFIAKRAAGKDDAVVVAAFKKQFGLLIKALNPTEAAVLMDGCVPQVDLDDKEATRTSALDSLREERATAILDEKEAREKRSRRKVDGNVAGEADDFVLDEPGAPKLEESHGGIAFSEQPLGQQRGARRRENVNRASEYLARRVHRRDKR